MSEAVACSECGSPVYTEDRFCGACGAPQPHAFTELNSPSTSSERAAKLLAELRALTAGEYEIRGEIGRGGMAVVYLAYDLRLNRKVAIKAMLPDLAFRDGMEERFKREARTAARLDHPNIVVIYSVRDSGDPLFFVMKYVDGAPLDALIRSHAPLPIPVVQGMLLQLCAALQYAHDDGVVHRDVKPANILIDTRGNVQVTDFGIAKAADSAHLTRTGMTIGTPAYMCPEQCLGKTQTVASDQYSVGVVAYELIAGMPPFTGSPIEIQWSHVRDVPKWISAVRPDCPAALATAVMRMLAKEPGERWPTLREAMPLIATGLAPESDGGRPALAGLVRATSSDRPSFAITPPSPVPHAAPRAAEPSTPLPPTRPAAAAPAAPTAPIERVEPVADMVSRVDVEPNVVAVKEHKSARLTVKAYTSKGKLLERPKFTFHSADPSIAEVNADGVLMGLAPGRTTGSVSVGDASATVIITVEPAHTATFPSPASPPNRRPILIGAAAVVLVAVGLVTLFVTRKPNASPQPIAATETAPTATPATSTGTVAPPVKPAVTAKLSPNAAAAAMPADTVVDSLELADKSPMSVEVGETKSILARVTNKRGELLPAVPVTWESSSPAVATIDADGVLNPLAAGRATITARVGARSRVLAIDVHDPVATRVAVSLAKDTMQVGESAPATAKVLGRHDTPMTGVGVAWKSLNESVVTVDERGVINALGAGKATVVASTGTIADSVSVVVRAQGQAAATEPAAPLMPSDAEAQAIADTVVTLIERRVIRLDQLLQGDTTTAAKFRTFLQTNEPSAKLSAAPTIGDKKNPGPRLMFGVVLDWDTGTSHKSRTVNLESVLDSVRGGWAIREIRFPTGFNP